MRDDFDKIWIMTANSSEAHCYEAKHLGRAMDLVKDFFHPESREKSLDLVTDKPGRYQSDGGYGHGVFEHTDPKDAEAERFAILLAKELDKAHSHQQFKKLVLIAPPHFNGLLNKHLNHQVANCISHKIEKDYTKMSEKELINYLDELPK